MKQRITPRQLRELNPEQQDKLRDWWKPQEGDWWKPVQSDEEQLLKDHDKECCISDHCGFGDFDTWCNYLKKSVLPLLSIGQCIEIIANITGILPQTRDIKLGLCQVLVHGLDKEFVATESIDALWEAIKMIL